MGGTIRSPTTRSTVRSSACAEEKPATSRPSPRSLRNFDIFRQALAVSTDAALLGAGSVGAAIIAGYDRSPNLTPESSSNVQNQIANLLPRLSIIVEHISRGAAQAQIQIKERLWQNKLTKNIISSTSSCLDRLHILKLLEDPPPLLFLAACTCFALAISVFQYRHGSERYNTRFLVVGGAIGVVLAALGTEDFVMDLKGYLAWSIITALLCSSLLHRVLQLWPDPDGRERPIKE